MLDAMRLTGDAPADAAITAIFEGREVKAAQSFMTHLMTNAEVLSSSLPPALREFVEQASEELLPDSARSRPRRVSSLTMDPKF